MQTSSAASWEEPKPVGEGREFRIDFGGNQGSAIFYNDMSIHVSVLTAGNG